jgi:hypothetical protein
MTKLKLFSLIVLVSFLNVCVSAVSTTEKDNTVSLSGSSVNPLGEFAHWAEYHKQSGRLDNILGKCYECIRDRSLGEKDEFSQNSALNSFSFPPFSSLSFFGGGTVGGFLTGPIVNSGGAFVSRGNRATGYGSTPYASSAGYTKNNYYNGYPLENKFSKSLSCVVGVFGVNAYVTACEYGNNYCQVTFGNGNIDGLCVPICVPSTDPFGTICSTGALSNKLAPICLVGSLAAGSDGAVPTVCNIGQMCQVDLAAPTKDGSCVFDCQNVPDTTSCSAADFGGADLRGPLCYVGTIGIDAQLLGCGIGDFCRVVIAAGVATGSCATACVNSTTTSCYTTDFGNKQGPVCFVGVFGDDALPMACANGQVCQRDTVITPFGTSFTTGSCQSVCVPSATTYCCNGDLCNSYQNTLNDRLCPTKKYQEESYGSSYATSAGYAASAAYGPNVAGYAPTPAYKY